MVHEHQKRQGVRVWQLRLGANGQHEWAKQSQFQGFILDQAAGSQPSTGVSGERQEVRTINNITLGKPPNQLTGQLILRADQNTMTLEVRVGKTVVVRFDGANPNISYAAGTDRYELDRLLETNFAPLFQNHLPYDPAQYRTSKVYAANVEHERLQALTAIRGSLTRHLQTAI